VRCGGMGCCDDYAIGIKAEVRSHPPDVCGSTASIEPVETEGGWGGKRMTDSAQTYECDNA
jgi:hypothetical protein